MMRASLVIVGVLCTIGVWCAEEKTVKTKVGLIGGVLETSHQHSVGFYAFRGIPFAKPPIGELRFKAPEPALSWGPGTLDASRLANSCIQPVFPFSSDPQPKSEDCLYLNVYVPANIKPDEKLAVMFFIHGGAYAIGSGADALYGPDFFVEKRVILVTSNYRLGALGFLSLGLPEYSGNMGMKDQQLALKWTYDNIGQFGGDNSRITIFGESAGASSTHLQLLSAESRKYFRNAIAMSGSALHRWAFATIPTHTRLAFDMASSLGRPQANVTDLIHFLHSVPAEEFAKVSGFEMTGTIGVPFAPVVESSDAVRPFITQTPVQIYENEQIDKDAVFGITSQECLGFCQPNPELKENFNLLLPFAGVDVPFDSPKYGPIRTELRDFYFKDTSAAKLAKNDEYIPLLSDVNFVYWSAQAAKMHATKSKGKAFFYHFAVESKLNVMKQTFKITAKPGAIHGDELCYVFHCNIARKFYDDVYATKDDAQSKISVATSDQMTKLFTNFAKLGEPTVSTKSGELAPVDAKRFPYVDITNTGLFVKDKFREPTIDFWSSIEQRARA